MKSVTKMVDLHLQVKKAELQAVEDGVKQVPLVELSRLVRGRTVLSTEAIRLCYKHPQNTPEGIVLREEIAAQEEKLTRDWLVGVTKGRMG